MSVPRYFGRRCCCEDLKPDCISAVVISMQCYADSYDSAYLRTARIRRHSDAHLCLSVKARTMPSVETVEEV